MADINPIDYATPLARAQTLVPDYVQQQLQRQLGALQTQNFALQNQEAAQKIAANDDAARDEAAFESAVADLGTNPTPDRYRALAARFPKFAPGINEAAKGMEGSQLTRVKGDLAQVHAALGASRPELARAIIQRHADADKAAGREPDPSDAALLAMIDSGDPVQLKAARGFAFSTLNALDPAAAKNITEAGTDGRVKGQVVGRAIGHYNDDGQWVTDYRDPETEYRSVKNADGSESIVQLSGGGGQTSGGGGASGGSGGPAAGRTQFGWTPRKRNGGDNSDAAVDSKIAGMSKSLGVSPDAPLDGMSNMQIAQALTLSEGGRGSLADTNNNPGNLRHPKTLAYRSFKTKDEGLRAAASQVARNRARGQNTIRSMVEGLPVGGQGGANSPSNTSKLPNEAAPSGGPRVVFTSKPGDRNPVDDATVQFYADKIAAGGDLPALGSGKEAAAWRQAILKRAAQVQTGAGMTGADSNLRFADARAARQALVQLQKTRSNVEGFEQTFQANVKEVLRLAPTGVAGSAPIFNRWIQAGRKSVQGDPQVSAFNVAVNTAANEYAKLASGASGGAVTSDSARHEAMEILNNQMTLPQLRAAIAQMQRDGHNRVVALNAQEKRLRSTISGKPEGASSAEQGIKKVRTVQEAMALPKVTIFIDPRGVRRRR